MAKESSFKPEGGVHAVAEHVYEYEDTQKLVALVNEAAELLRTKGEAALKEFRTPDTRWRKGETYIFVVDIDGKMLVHPDPALEGKNESDLKDVNGKPIIRGLINVATAEPDKPEGWYHYQWPVPGGLLPRWKSSFVELVKTPEGKSYIVGSGMYNDRMERAFVVDLVNKAVAEIEKRGPAAYALLRDPSGPFRAKDTYVFVMDSNAVELVNPAFPNLEGRDLIDMRDSHGKPLNRELLKVINTEGCGWVDYTWPKPGDNVPTQKSTYACKAMFGDTPLLVGCGVYLPEAPIETKPVTRMDARELMTLVRQGAAILQEQGENAYAEFRKQGSKWLRDDTYFFIYAPDGTCVFHAAEPAKEGRNEMDLKDILGRPVVKMILAASETQTGEGWVHYMYPQPAELFPAWKSAFVKRVKYPSDKQYILGCGIYHMKMDKEFIEDVVSRAAALLAERGKEAFPILRDKTGPFNFMDTYVFVETLNGVELVNGGHPSLEGKNLNEVRDIDGKYAVKEEIAAALKDGTAWTECKWYKPGSNAPTLKKTYVRKVQAGTETYIVGSGIYTT